MGSDHDHQILASLKRRNRAEKRFQYYGMGGLICAGAALILLLWNIIVPSLDGFVRYELTSEIRTAATETKVDYFAMMREQLSGAVALDGLEDPHSKAFAALFTLATHSIVEEAVKEEGAAPSDAISVSIPLSDKADYYLKNRDSEAVLLLSETQRAWLHTLEGKGLVSLHFDINFLGYGDSREPELAGYGGAVVGSLFTMLICILLALPIALGSAIYLEEFAPKNLFTDMIEVSINNLAAVPSIIYGLLGLVVYLQFMELPRSSALVGGLTLALMTLPVIIIAARAAISAVPYSIRQAAWCIGATPLQTTWQHVVPYELAGIMTGTILGVARVIGETAPLLMIGMVAFVADIPEDILDPATVMPVQIYLWASSPELGFAAKTSAGIFLLLLILLAMNALAIMVRKTYEIRW